MVNKPHLTAVHRGWHVGANREVHSVLMGVSSDQSMEVLDTTQHQLTKPYHSERVLELLNLMEWQELMDSIEYQNSYQGYSCGNGLDKY